MSDDEMSLEMRVETLEELLDAERKRRRSIEVDLDRLEERVDSLKGLVGSQALTPDGGDADGE